MRILFLDNDPARHAALDDSLQGAYDVSHVYSVDNAVEALKGERFDGPASGLNCGWDPTVEALLEARNKPLTTVPGIAPYRDPGGGYVEILVQEGPPEDDQVPG